MKFVPRPLLSSPCIEEGFKQKAWKVQISERNLPFSQGELFSEEIRKSILYSQYNAFWSFSFFVLIKCRWRESRGLVIA